MKRSTLLVHLANASFRAGNRELAYDAETGPVSAGYPSSALV